MDSPSNTPEAFLDLVARYWSGDESVQSQLIQWLKTNPELRQRVERLGQLAACGDSDTNTNELTVLAPLIENHLTDLEPATLAIVPPTRFNAAARESATHGSDARDARDHAADDVNGSNSAVGSSSSSSTPTRLGNYALLSEIARGGMGIVYRARDLTLDRIVAVKMILAGSLATSSDIERFRVEAEAAAQLSHPAIVSIYELGYDAGHHFFAMSLITGSSLAERIAQQPLSNHEAAHLLISIAQAIAYAHERGVVHRDLKPANVLLDQKGEPHITDFGLAKRSDHDSQLTASGQILGTPSYMAPEQASGNTEAIGPAADIYALGAILYAMLIGHPPVAGATAVETLRMVIERDPTHPSEYNADIEQDLETICLKCLKKSQLDRYRTVSDLIAELQRFLRGEPIHARPIGAWELIKRYRSTLHHNQMVRVRTARRLGSLPLVDIARGADAQLGETLGHAKGIIAIGDRASGVLAFGDQATGVVAFGATAIGLFAFGTHALGLATCGLISMGAISWGALALGGIAFGGVSVGWTAVRGIAFGMYSFGALATGWAGWGIGRADPVARDYFEQLFSRLLYFRSR